ncbi:MAG: tetratricopeptide repeat protein [Deltaproteobacteria bacterium]|nr:tetratricopeptide repeat protein [Deltaproteobacteria bacterium]
MRYLKAIFASLLVSVLIVGVAFSESVDDYLNKANMLFKNKDYEGTITELRKALEILKKDNPAAAQQVQMNIGLNYVRLEKYQEAIQELEAALALNKKPDPKIDLKLNQILATAHYNLGHYALRAAILEGLFKRIKDIDDETKADMLAQLGDAYRRNEIHSKAIQYYGEAAKLFEKLKKQDRQALVLTAMGLSQSKLGDFPGATKSLNMALELAKNLNNPLNTAETYSNLGIVQWDQGEYAKALELVNLAKEVESKGNLKRNLGADFNNEGLIYKSVGLYPKAMEAINQAIKIAQEIKDRQSEAIALSNRALLYRILGKNADALKDYQAALKIYDDVKFLEGTASCRLGLGKLYEVHEHDFTKANEAYQKALEMYKQLGNLTYQAETLNQIGRVLKKSIDPKRASRDLIFEEGEPKLLAVKPEEAAEKSTAAYKEALELAKKVNKREAIWSAQQGLGYALKSQGQEEEACKYYQEAVNMVVGIRGGTDSDLLGNYLNDKEDLFTEAIELCRILFEKTKKPEYQRLMMQYEEIYKNEVMKTAMNGAKLEFQDKNKAGIFDQIQKTLAEKDKLDQLSAKQQNLLAKAPASESEKIEQSQLKKDVETENKQVTVRAKKLEGTLEELFNKWKKQYPNDAGLFDSSARVDLTSIQKTLKDDQALIQYFPLNDKLSILCVTKTEIKGADVAIAYEDLASLIRDQFTYENIELYGHGKTKLTEEQSFENCNKVLNKLYTLLLAPVEREIAEKNKLIIVPSKYIGYVPFSALVTKFDGKEPHYLVQDKTVTYIRLSFFDQVFAKRKKIDFAKNRLMAVGNPTHAFLKAGLPDLPGAEKEIQGAMNAAKKMDSAEALYREEATETTWHQQPYTVFYFATHGVPFAEIMYDRKATIGPALVKMKKRMEAETDPTKKQQLEAKVKGLEEFEKFCDQTFKSKSPMNGFLYLSYSGKEEDNGVLTLKKIMEMPESVFKEANLAILSACNTAVTYSPKVDDKIRKESESSEIDRELAAAGFTPGVDQVCLSDTFMKRNFNSVMGTLWFADDQATGFIIAKFFEGLADKLPSDALRAAQLAYLEKPPLAPDYTKVPKHPYYWAVSAVFGD